MELNFEDWLEERITRHVDSSGKVSRRRDRKTRSRRAVQTTGRSRSDLKRSARKSARTRKRSPGTQRKALRKRKRTLRKRKSRLGSKA